MVVSLKNLTPKPKTLHPKPHMPESLLCRLQEGNPSVWETHMSYSLTSLKGGYIGDYMGTSIGVIKGDTRSLDYSSYEDPTSFKATLLSY